VKGEVRSIIVIEVLPGCQLCIEIHIIRVGQQLIKLGLSGSVGSFDFTVELRGSRFDVDTLDALVFHMPVEAGLKFVHSVGSDRVGPERKLLDHVIHELDGTRLVMLREDHKARIRVASSMAVY